MSRSIEDEKKKINEKINAGDYKGADSAITALLKRTSNQDVLYLKARIYMLINKPEYERANDERKTKIREESIKRANEIVGRSNNAYGYKLKGMVLSELDPNNDILLKEQYKAYREAQKYDLHNLYSADLTPLINFIKRKVPDIDDDPEPDRRTPIASFTVSTSSGKAPLIVQFTDTSINSPTSWEWKFGDGAESRSQHSSHTFQKVGTYTVSLTVTNAQGSHHYTLPACVVVREIDDVGEGVKPDPTGIYEKSLVALVKDHPGIIEMIILENEQKLQIKGFLYDAFEGNTPKEFNILLHCIDEMVPFTICKFHNEEVMLKNRLRIRKNALIDRAYSKDFVKWGITTWKKALCPLLVRRDPAIDTESGERGYSF